MNGEEAAPTHAEEVRDVRRQREAVRLDRRSAGSGDLHDMLGDRPGLNVGAVLSHLVGSSPGDRSSGKRLVVHEIRMSEMRLGVPPFQRLELQPREGES